MKLTRASVVFIVCTAIWITSIAFPKDALAAGGDLDPTFGSGGWLDLDVFDDPNGTGVAIRSDGDILVSIGSAWSDVFAVARFLPDGTPDPSFGDQGYVETEFSGKSSAEDVLLQPDGAIVVGGRSGRRIVAARYLWDGTLDPSFGGDGKISVPVDDRWTDVSAGGLSSRGEIVLVGTTHRGRHSTAFVVRLTPSGDLDPNFSGDGRVRLQLGRCHCSGAGDVATGPDGRVIVVGWTKSWAAIAVLDEHGRLDPAFGGGGIVRTRFLTSRDRAGAFAVTTTPTAAILVSGAVSGAWGPDGRLARFLSDGRLDPTFSGDGVRAFPSAWPEAVVLQSDGKIVVGGAECCGGGSELFFGLWRFGPDGARDLDFGMKGFVGEGPDEGLSVDGWAAVASQADDRIVVSGGRESGGLVLARYLG